MKHILAMMPAVGWRAVYWLESGIAEWSPLVAWVLVHDDEFVDPDEKHVEGLVSFCGEIEFADRNHNFLDYAGPGQELAEWHQMAARCAYADAQQRKAGPRST